MAKQLSSIDIHYLVAELQELVGSRIDKVYNLGKEELYLQFHKANQGKKLVRFVLGKALFLTESKDIESSPSDFCMVLRKHLEGKFLDEMVQLKPERIIRMTFHSKEEERIVYIELFSKGNLILCNNSLIVDCLLRQKFKDRTLLPKQPYTHPRMRYDPFVLGDLAGFFENSQKETVVIALATELGIGGLYAEEICLLSKVEKTTSPKDLTAIQVKTIGKNMHSLLTKKLNPSLVIDGEKIVDVIPFALSLFEDKEKKECKSFSEAIELFFASAAEPKKSLHQKKIEELGRIIAEQEQSVVSLEQQEQDAKRKGERIYEQYALIEDLLKQIKEAKKTHSWEEIKGKLERHPKIKAVDLKEKKVVIDI